MNSSDKLTKNNGNNNLHVIAGVKKMDSKYYKILSNCCVFKMPENVEYLIYDSDHKLDSDSWFEIAEFSKQKYCINFVKNPFESTSYKLLDKKKIENIEFICYVENGEKYFFQKITPASIISRKVIRFKNIVIDKKSTSNSGEEDFEYDDNKKTSEIVIKEEADAIYVKSQDVLYFRNLRTINSIFKGIDVLYKEATKESVTEFVQSLPIIMDDKYSINHIKSENRRRITEAKETVDKLDDKQKQQLLSVIREYCPNLVCATTNHFKIKNEQDLKMFLYGVNERFYTTECTAEKRVANSVRKL